MITNEYKPTNNLKITQIIIKGNKHPGACLVDSEDTLMLRQHRWTINKCGYVVCTLHKELMHRLVLKVNHGDITDHKNRNTTDNRKINLRIVTHQENMHNRQASSNSLIPVKGVYLDKNSWRSEITVNNKKKRLGSFDDIYDAVCARIRAEIELYGDKTPSYKAILRHIPSRYLIFWFPEVYGKGSHHYIGSDFHKGFFTYTKELGNSAGMRSKIRRYRNKARSEARYDIKKDIGIIPSL